MQDATQERCPYGTIDDYKKKQLFLDIQKTPPLAIKGSFGEWFHTWLEDQAAEGYPLGEIARRLELPVYDGEDEDDDGWAFLDRHVAWMIQQGYARVVFIHVVA